MEYFAGESDWRDLGDDEQGIVRSVKVCWGCEGWLLALWK